jgi:hypothetical protein
MNHTHPDIRWQQRFQNFDRAFTLLDSALKDRPLDAYSALEQEGIIQRFEYAYELAWKTMKDFLEDGQVWIDMMLHRNQLAHTYDYSKFREVLDAARDRYHPAMSSLRAWLATQVQA